MKKLLVLSAILAGAASASQAGVNLHFGLPLPLPTPLGLVLTHSAPVFVPAAPVVRPEVVVTPSLCEPQLVTAPMCGPKVVMAPDRYAYGHAYWPDRHEWWEHRSGWHDRDDRNRHGHDGYRR
jgi:hypothetical protein